MVGFDNYYIGKKILLLEATFFIIIFTYLPEVDIQVQNRQGVLGNIIQYVL